MKSDKMGRIITMATAFVLILTISILSTGCSGDSSKSEKEPLNVCILVEKHANADIVGIETVLQTTEYHTVLSECFSTGRTVNVKGFEVDGSPYMFLNASVDAIDSRLTEQKQQQIINKNISAISEEIGNVKPSTEEVDVLEAFYIASNSSVDKIIYIGGGIYTVGALPVLNDIVNADVKSVINELKEREMLPNLTGTDIYWFGCGDLAGGKQCVPDMGSKDKLSEFWKLFLEESGAEVDMFDARFGKSEEYCPLKEWPQVTPIVFNDDMPFTWEGNLPSNSQAAMIYEDQIAFRPDTSSFMDKEKAYEIIAGIAKEMRETPDYKLAVVGTTAGDDVTEHALVLSKERAQAIADMLNDMGIEKTRVISIGVANQDPWHVSGLGTGSEAAPNRKVVLLNANSTIVEELIEKEYELSKNM